MSKNEIEILGASGHGIALSMNVLGYLWNRKGNKFFKVFHATAAIIHAYALYIHVRGARENDG